MALGAGPAAAALSALSSACPRLGRREADGADKRAMPPGPRPSGIVTGDVVEALLFVRSQWLETCNTRTRCTLNERSRHTEPHSDKHLSYKQ